MNTKVEEALEVQQAGHIGFKEAVYRKRDVDRYITQQDATIARMQKAVLAAIPRLNPPEPRDSHEYVERYERFQRDMEWTRERIIAALNQEQGK